MFLIVGILARRKEKERLKDSYHFKKVDQRIRLSPEKQPENLSFSQKLQNKTRFKQLLKMLKEPRVPQIW